MLRLPLIVLLALPGAAHAQKFVSPNDEPTAAVTQTDASSEPEVIIPYDERADAGQAAEANRSLPPASESRSAATSADPGAADNGGAIVQASFDDSIYVDSEHHSLGSIEIGDIVELIPLETISEGDIVTLEDGNFVTIALELGECNPGSAWDEAGLECVALTN